MKTNELTGVLLDCWVARADVHQAEIITDEKGDFCVRTILFDGGGKSRGPFAPSSNWGDGGPIIARECGSFEFYPALEDVDEPVISARMGRDPLTRGCQSGPTHLVAAMRAYVFGKYGDEVPDEVR